MNSLQNDIEEIKVDLKIIKERINYIMDLIEQIKELRW